jgi:hypothetical protein
MDLIMQFGWDHEHCSQVHWHLMGLPNVVGNAVLMVKSSHCSWDEIDMLNLILSAEGVVCYCRVICAGNKCACLYFGVNITHQRLFVWEMELQTRRKIS